jgi:hypothetical protein
MSTGLVIAKRQIRGGVDETKQRIMLDLTKRWGLKWEEDQK